MRKEYTSDDELLAAFESLQDKLQRDTKLKAMVSLMTWLSSFTKDVVTNSDLDCNGANHVVAQELKRIARQLEIPSRIGF